MWVAAMLPWGAVPQPLAAAGAWHGGGSPVEDMDARAVAAVSVLVTQRVAASAPSCHRCAAEIQWQFHNGTAPRAGRESRSQTALLAFVCTAVGPC